MAEPTEDSDARVDHGPVVDYLVPRRATSRHLGAHLHLLAVWCGTLLFLVCGVGLIGYTPSWWQQGQAMLEARTCTNAQLAAGATDDCFVEVPGRIQARLTRGEWRFAPDIAGRRPGYVRFADDGFDRAKWPPDLTRVLDGEHTTALYWNGEPVAFVVGGQRVETMSFGTTSVDVGVWGGVMSLSLGIAGLHLLLGRPAGRLRLLLCASALGALAGLVLAAVLEVAPATGSPLKQVCGCWPCSWLLSCQRHGSGRGSGRPSHHRACGAGATVAPGRMWGRYGDRDERARRPLLHRRARVGRGAPQHRRAPRGPAGHADDRQGRLLPRAS